MIQMGQASDGELAVFGKVNQQSRQGHRVGSARQPHQHARAGGHEPVAANGPTNLLMKSCHVPSPSHQIPSPKSAVARWDPGSGIWTSMVPEGGLEPPTPRL